MSMYAHAPRERVGSVTLCWHSHAGIVMLSHVSIVALYNSVMAGILLAVLAQNFKAEYFKVIITQ